MSVFFDLSSYPVKPVLNRLLQDKTTKQNIIFATDAYAYKGEEFAEKAQITAEKLCGPGGVRILPRVEKALEEQTLRQRKKAEVFTPSWVVNKMNNHCDEEWFSAPNVFNTEDGTGWIVTKDRIPFDEKRTWKKYVDSKRIEITCGEAPYIVSRYDTTTGEPIPIERRIGILDRKLRVVNENAADDAEWLKWTERAFQSSYGYEYQGDNLLIARINVLLTFVEYYEARFHQQPTEKILRRYATIICWNFWQMDGITGTIPLSVPQTKEDETPQYSFLGFFDGVIDNFAIEESPEIMPICRIMDWRDDRSVSYDDIRGGKGR